MNDCLVNTSKETQTPSQFAFSNATLRHISRNFTRTKCNCGLTFCCGRYYSQGIIIPDRRIVFVPYGSRNIGILDTDTNEMIYIPIQQVETDKCLGFYSGGVLLSDGRVVFVPYNSIDIGIFTPSTNSFETVPLDIHSKNYLYSGGVLLPDRRVVFVPYNSKNIGIFNPDTNEMSSIPSEGVYSGGVYLEDGRVIFVPNGANSVGISRTIGIFNCVSDTFDTIEYDPDPEPNYGEYSGGMLLPDGRVFFIPHYAKTIGIFNPSTNEFTRSQINYEIDGGDRGIIVDRRFIFEPLPLI